MHICPCPSRVCSHHCLINRSGVCDQKSNKVNNNWNLVGELFSGGDQFSLNVSTVVNVSKTSVMCMYSHPHNPSFICWHLDVLYRTPNFSHCIHEFPSHVDISHCAALWQQYRMECVDKLQEMSRIYPVWTPFMCQSCAKPTRNCVTVGKKTLSPQNQDALLHLSSALQFCFFEKTNNTCNLKITFANGDFPLLYIHIWLRVFIQYMTFF